MVVRAPVEAGRARAPAPFNGVKIARRLIYSVIRAAGRSQLRQGRGVEPLPTLLTGRVPYS